MTGPIMKRLNFSNFLRHLGGKSPHAKVVSADDLERLRAALNDSVLAHVAMFLTAPAILGQTVPLPQRSAGPVVSIESGEVCSAPVIIGGKPARLLYDQCGMTLDLDDAPSDLVAKFSSLPKIRQRNINHHATLVGGNLAELIALLCRKVKLQPRIAAISPIETAAEELASLPTVLSVGEIQQTANIILPDGTKAILGLGYTGAILFVAGRAGWLSYAELQKVIASSSGDVATENGRDYSAYHPAQIDIPQTSTIAEADRLRNFVGECGLPGQELVPIEDKSMERAGSSPRVGGMPYAEKGTDWPSCRVSGKSLVFLCQFEDVFAPPAKTMPLVQIFVCPHGCDHGIAPVQEMRIWTTYDKARCVEMPGAPEAKRGWRLDCGRKFRSVGTTASGLAGPIDLVTKRPDSLSDIDTVSAMVPEDYPEPYGFSGIRLGGSAIDVQSDGGPMRTEAESSSGAIQDSRHIMSFGTGPSPWRYKSWACPYPIVISGFDRGLPFVSAHLNYD